jgi:hypothetical protein
MAISANFLAANKQDHPLSRMFEHAGKITAKYTIWAENRHEID